METLKLPGEELKRILAEKGLSQTDLAFILGKSVSVVNSLVASRVGISPEMSKALGEALNLSHDYFAALQQKLELASAESPDPSVTLRAKMMSTYPIREMIKREWIKDADAEGLQRQLASFFNVSDVNQVPYLAHAAKKSKYEEREIPPAQLAWLFRVKQIAKKMVPQRYSERALRDAVTRMRAMLESPEEIRHVPRLLNESGVRFVLVESLPGAKIDGVCFWLDKNSPVIGMSLRFDRIDNFWFVLRHEIEHVLNNDGKTMSIVDANIVGEESASTDHVSEEEKIANAAASDFCVPSDKMESFIKRKHPTYHDIAVLSFAKLQHTHPAIVAGQIQRRLNRYDILTKYQVKIRQFILPGAMADGWNRALPIWEDS